MLAPIFLYIPKDLFEPAATRSFEGAAPGFDLHLGADDHIFDAPVAWKVDVTNTGGALLVAGTVQARCHCACARCLEPAEYDVEGQIEGYFLIPGEQADLDDLEADEFDTLPADHRIDLAPLIQAALVLEVPRVPLCAEDCAGLCPVCGQNLNEGACACAHDEQAAPAGPFAALKDLKLD